MMGLVAHCIQKIQGFTDSLVHVGIIENHLVRQSLYCKLESQMGAYIACTDNTDFSSFD